MASELEDRMGVQYACRRRDYGALGRETIYQVMRLAPMYVPEGLGIRSADYKPTGDVYEEAAVPFMHEDVRKARELILAKHAGSRNADGKVVQEPVERKAESTEKVARVERRQAEQVQAGEPRANAQAEPKRAFSQPQSEQARQVGQPQAGQPKQAQRGGWNDATHRPQAPEETDEYKQWRRDREYYQRNVEPEQSARHRKVQKKWRQFTPEGLMLDELIHGNVPAPREPVRRYVTDPLPGEPAPQKTVGQARVEMTFKEQMEHAKALNDLRASLKQERHMVAWEMERTGTGLWSDDPYERDVWMVRVAEDDIYAGKNYNWGLGDPVPGSASGPPDASLEM